jgi:two-component system, chemotaxis family, protein-glutamate methylesterase/glutaminase
METIDPFPHPRRGRASESLLKEPTELGHDIVVVGASAGGVEALVELMRDLPADLPAAIFIVLHVAATETSVLPRILERHSDLPVKHAIDGEPIVLGQVYVAPPDRHLLIHPDHVRVVRGPRENNHRPAVDPLFRSAALAYGPRVVGLVLSGSLDDGAAGLHAVSRAGGTGIVQDPEDALYRGMPDNAIAADEPDFVVPLHAVPDILIRLTQEPAEELHEVPAEVGQETAYAEFDSETFDMPPGERSVFSCPDCGGVLYELEEGGLLRYRCRIGHAYAAESLHAAQSEAIDVALGTALRALEERAVMSRRLAKRLESSGRRQNISRYTARADEADANAALLRRVIAGRAGPFEEVPS